MNRLVLKASAGTGKTYRLSLEYVLALAKGQDYKNILVMTFTRKATAEIKKEVIEKLKTFVDLYRNIKTSELNFLNSKNILEILKSENINMLEAEKNKYISLTESLEKISDLKIDMKTLANLETIYEDILKNKEKIKIYTIDAFINIVFKNLIINFLKITSYSMIDEKDNDFYYKKVLENLLANNKLSSTFKDFFVENAEKNIDNYIEAIEDIICDRWKYLLSLNENNEYPLKEEIKVSSDPSKILKDILDYIQDDCKRDLEKALRKDYKIYIGLNEDEINKIINDEFKNILSKAPYNGTHFKAKKDAEIKEVLNDMYEDLKENLSTKLYNELLIPSEKEIINLSEYIYSIYDEFKIRDKKFSFDDITTYTYSILFNKKNALIGDNGLNDAFFEALDMKIDTIFIDEFQDTSILQWKILYEIIKKAENVICVGDEKQSIYGFRGGEKKLFENLNNILNDKVDSLDTSYRSDKNIVAYTNKIFNTISENNPSWKFEDSKVNSKEEGYVKCVHCEASKKSKEEQIPEKNSIQILVNELKKIGPKNYSDIAILTRKNIELDKISKMLEAEKIPYILNKNILTNELSGIFEYLELLKYLAYNSELSLFNFMASNLSNFGTDEIEVLLKNKRTLFNFLNDTLEKENNFEQIFSEKIIIFLKKIKEVKKFSKTSNSFDLTYKILRIFEFSNVFSSETELKYQAELYLFSKKFENILSLIKAFENNEVSFSENLITKGAIQLMSVHKSKGLQFETVFVLNKNYSNSGKRRPKIKFIFSMNSTYSKVSFSMFLKRDYIPILTVLRPKEFEEIKTIEIEEEINNLYVALTRAKNNLIVISETLPDEEVGKIKKSSTDENIIAEEREREIENECETFILDNREENIDKLEEFEINNSKFLLKTEEKRMLGILIHYFLENIKLGTKEEIDYSKKLCYKNYLSYFGEKKLKNIFSDKNIEHIFKVVGDIFSKKWDHIYSEYRLYDNENKNEYRIDRMMIKDDRNDERGEIYIVDYKTGAKNENQLKNYVEVLRRNYSKEIENYDIRTKFLEFNIKY